MEFKEMKFLMISPVRNEEKHIETTIQCMISQTLLPHKWIIIDDGSTDSTGAVIKKYSKKYSFIQYIFNRDRGFRKPGQGVINAFYRGFNTLEDHDFDVVSKFDGDLQFPENMLSTLASYFQSNPRLGITGPTLYERDFSNKLAKCIVPAGYVNGPCKFYRKQCFLDINGLIKRAGWDGVDMIKANMHGWETFEIPELKIIHLRGMGMAKGEGLKRAFMKYGDISYYMGGYFWYFLLRIIYRTYYTKKPVLFYYMLKGYLDSRKKRQKRESRDFRKYLRRKQLKDMKFWFKHFFKRG